MKLLVETTGSFQLLCADQKTLIRHDGATLVTNTSFVEHRAAAGQLRILAQVNDEATDAEWLAFAKECGADRTLAIESFKSKFPLPGAEPKPVAPPAPPPAATPTKVVAKKG